MKLSDYITNKSIQIKGGKEKAFRDCFQPILDDIEKMYWTYKVNKVDQVYITEEDAIFISSNVMRNQLRGLSEMSPEEKENRPALR